MKKAQRTRKNFSLLRFFILPALIGANCVGAQAQDRNTLLSRLDRIEERLAVLQGQPTAGDPASPVASTARYEIAISAMQEELRRLRGDIEKLRHHQQQLRTSMTRLEKDMDLRLKMLEDQPRSPIKTEAPNPPVIEPDAENRANEMSKLLPTGPMAEVPAGTETKPTPTPTPNEEYQLAFDTLNEGNYSSAEQRFARFIEQYPDHNLIGNAYYWLGETYYVQDRFESAAEQFRKGFQVLPEGPKAPDNLLKLGMTLDVLDRRDEACIILQQLLSKYTGRSKAVLRKARRESEKLGCK